MNRIFILIFLVGLMSSCEESYIPKPRGYYRIALPKKEYNRVEAPQFSFELLKSASYTIKPTDHTWSTIEYPSIKASLYLSFFEDSNIEKLTEDARKSAYKHAIKADDIVNIPFAIPERRVFGVVYSIEGNAATPVIFQFTDSIDQFVHGALYFNCEPNFDSLKPVVNFVRQDIEHIIETFEWKSKAEILK